MASLNPPTPNGTDTGAGLTLGTRFHATANQQVTAIKWYGTSVTNFPDRVSIYNITDSVTLWTTVPTALNWGSPTSNWYTLSTTGLGGGPPTLVSGKNYVVTIYNEGSGATKYYSNGGGGSPDSPLVVDYWAVQQSGDVQNPNSTDFSNTRYGLDIVTQTPPAPPPPEGNDGDAPTNSTISGRLAQWVSSDPAVNTHELDGLPWLTHVLAQSIDSATAETLQLITALASYGGAIAFGSSDDKLKAIGGVLQAIWTDAPGGVPRMETALLNRIGLAQDTLSDTISGNAGTRFGGDATGVAAVGAWTLTDTLVGSGDAAWDHAGDKYVLTITAWGATRRWGAIAGVPYYGHRGFWAPLEVDLVGDYRPIVGRKHLLHIPGQRLQGVLVGLEPDLEWTLEAYDWVGA